MNRKDFKPIVYIVDDDAEVLNALTWLLESVNLKTECFERANDFLDNFDPSKCGCIITDVRMPIMSGLHLYEQLKQQDNHLPVIFLTGHGDIPMAVQSIKNGAFDFISKPFNDHYLLEQVQKAINFNINEHLNNQAANIEDLTPREKEILDLIVIGKLNKQIAHELKISNSTVEFHRAKIMKKMRAKNLAHLLKIYLKG